MLAAPMQGLNSRAQFIRGPLRKHAQHFIAEQHPKLTPRSNASGFMAGRQALGSEGPGFPKADTPNQWTPNQANTRAPGLV